MANPPSNHHHHLHHAAVLLVFLILISSSSLSSSARLLNDFNLALPSDTAVPEKEEITAGHGRVTGKLPSPPVMRIRGGKYRPIMILNMLPKGTVPSSGPSKRSNNINN